MARSSDSIGYVLPEREEEIAALAEAVANDHCPTGKVDPPAIARQNGITLSYNSYLLAFDGMLEHRNGRFHIYCNLNRVGEPDSARARFTLSHELGHFFLDEHRNVLASGRALPHRSTCDYESKNPAEREADCFASNLVMPPSRFLPRARASTIGMPRILELAEEFGTSVTSTALRYTKCNIRPCAVLKWGPEALGWRWVSEAFYQARLIDTVKSAGEVPNDSATGRALAGEPPPERGYFECGTTAATWFPRLGSASYKNDILIEQAIVLGRFGVLTFLYADNSFA